MFQKRAKEPTEKVFFQKFADNCKAPGSRKYLLDMYNVDCKIDLFDMYKTDYLLEFMFLFADREYRGQKLGQGVCHYSLELGKSLAAHKTITTLPDQYKDVDIRGSCGLCTSNISLRVFKNEDFHKQLAVSYDKFEYNGTKYSEAQPQKEIVLVSRSLL